MKATKVARVYNAGDRVQETMVYTKPDGSDIHANGHWLADLAAEAITEIPAEFQEGVATVHVRFAQDLLRRHGTRGVILVDRNLEGERLSEDDPRAATESEARQKGKRLWLEFCRKVVGAYQDEVALAKSRGVPPRRPIGFTRRAMGILGVKDPTEEMLLQASTAQSDVAQLRATVEKQQKLLEELLAAQRQELPLERSGKQRPATT